MKDIFLFSRYFHCREKAQVFSTSSYSCSEEGEDIGVRSVTKEFILQKRDFRVWDEERSQ